jgi:hypothetical protein
VGIIISFIYGNRALPMLILALGCGILWAVFAGLAGWWGIAGLAILSVVIWIANKIDMT